jgi:hypothetical protein
MNIDDSDLPMEWKVWVEDNGVRARDGAGLDQYIGDADALGDAEHEETFTIETAGGDTELRISTASSNPDASVIKVETSKKSDEATVLVMDVESKDGESVLNKLVFFATTSDSDLIDVINDVTLDIDGNTFTEWYYAETAGGAADTDPDESGDIVFNLEDEDDEYELGEDEEVTVKLIVEFKQLTTNYIEGTTVEFDVTSAERDEWLVDDVNGDDLDDSTGKSGTANGEEHTLYSEGIFAEINSITETSKSDGTVDDAIGTYKFVVDITAFEDTFYIDATSTSVWGITVLEADGDTATPTPSIVVTSTASKESSTGYRIDDGDTESFTVTVTFDPAVADNYQVTLDSVEYGDTAASPFGEDYSFTPVEDYESDYLYLNV